MKVGFFPFLIPFSKDVRWSLLKFVITTSDFRCASDYTMTDNTFLLVIGSIGG